MVQGIICMTLHLHVLLHIQEMAKYTQVVDTYPGSETCIRGIIEAFKIPGRGTGTLRCFEEFIILYIIRNHSEEICKAMPLKQRT